MPTYTKPVSGLATNPPPPSNPYKDVQSSQTSAAQAHNLLVKGGAPGVPVQGPSQGTANSVEYLRLQQHANRKFDGGRRTKRRKSRRNRKSKKYRKKSRR